MHFPVKVQNIEPAGTVSVVSPYDGAVVGSIDTVGFKGIEKALSIAAALYRKRSSWLSAQQRATILDRAATLMEARSGQLIALAVAEGGKPYQDTKVELARAIDSIRICRECLRSQHGVEIPMQLNAASMHKLAFTHREPIGPVIAISAFNHPINLIFRYKSRSRSRNKYFKFKIPDFLIDNIK